MPDLRLGMQNYQNDLFQEIDKIVEGRLLDTNPEAHADHINELESPFEQ